MTVPTHGAQWLDSGLTRFALWAPDRHHVTVELDDGTRIPLEPLADGWFAECLPCPPGTAYRFLLDDELRVPDPASRSQLDDVHGFSLVDDPGAYRWRNKEWRGRPWHEAVIYELHVGLLGGFAEVEAYLPALCDLGVTAIELMPLGEFPGKRNWGYDGVLPFAPDASYGSPEELRSLVDRAHELGLMVLVDVIYNHFGPDGNYLGQYASVFFREDRQTPWGASIDFRREQVRNFYIENALMWLRDYRMDGLRLDAVHAIDDREFMLQLAARVRTEFKGGRQVHLILENEFNQASLLDQGYDAQWNDDGHNALHVLLTGETHGYYADFAEKPEVHLARCLAEGFVYQGELNRHGKPRGESSASLPPTAFVLFLQNHDQVGNRAFGERLSILAEPDALRAAAVLLLLSPMIPLLFMGEEWGSTQPFLFFTDHSEELGRAVRDGRRSEFAEFPAFADSALRETIPDPNCAGTFNRCLPDLELSSQHHRDALAFYRKLLALRREQLFPRLAGSRAQGAEVLGSHAVRANWRLGDGSQLQIAINLGASPVACPAPGLRAKTLYAWRVSEVDHDNGQLPGHSALVSLEASP